MRTILRLGAMGTGILLLLIPISLVLTFVAFPVWSWIEKSFAIESVGHSGPAEWCFLATYAACAFAVAIFLWVRRRKALPGSDPA